MPDHDYGDLTPHDYVPVDPDDLTIGCAAPSCGWAADDAIHQVVIAEILDAPPVDAYSVDPLDVTVDVADADNPRFLTLVHNRLHVLAPVGPLGRRARDEALLTRLRQLAVSLSTVTAAGGFAAPAGGAYQFPMVTAGRGGIDFSARPATGSAGFLIDTTPPDLTDPVVVMRLAADELDGTYEDDDLVRALHDCANVLAAARRPKPPAWKNAMWRGRRALADWADPDRAER